MVQYVGFCGAWLCGSHKVYCKYVERVLLKSCDDFPTKCNTCKHNKYEKLQEDLKSLKKTTCYKEKQ